MTSSEIPSLIEKFEEKNLVFHPDLRKVDPLKHYRYCSIQGLQDREHYHRSPDDSKNELMLRQKWRPFFANGTPNPYYSLNKARLENYLKNYKNGGIDLLETTFLEILNDERIKEKFESLPGLRKFFKLSNETEMELMEKFANVMRIALRVEEVLSERIYRLVDDVMSATFSQEQCAVLLAWMFFDTRRNRSFIQILTSIHPISIEKIKFLLHYFSKISDEMPDGNVSFTRLKDEEFKEKHLEKREKMDQKLVDVTILYDLPIEETAICTQVDFANKHIGGGVLRLGGVQEEIRFLMCPEMIVSMLLFDKMGPDEAISIVGAQVYSSYSGYSGKLKYRELTTEHSLQNNYRDEFGRIKTEALAINAIKFFGRQSKNLGQQMEKWNLDKEILKSAVGFCAQGTEFSGIPIVSGWWGCGAYNGNKPLKFLIQLISASLAGRPLYFSTFGETAIGNKCMQMKRRLDMDHITIGELYDLLLRIPKMEIYDEMHVFDSIEEMLCNRN